ncbi:MAG: very-short-patch-repair endonuclease [Myxococcota bacterium]|jgi:very-short-patch-repair endonuclease
MLTLQLQHQPVIQLALQQAGFPAVHRVRLHWSGEAPLHDVALRLTVDPAVATPLELHVERIAPDGEAVFETVDLALSVDALVAQVERAEGHLRVEATVDGEVVASTLGDVAILPYNAWPGLAAPAELLTAFVLPNHPALGEVLAGARAAMAAATGRDALDGYQSGDRERVWHQAAAVYAAVARLGLGYANPPASFEESGQKVRTPDQVVEQRLGTCLDLTLLLAAVLEQIGLHPLLVIVRGHAFPGVWLVDRPLGAPLVDEAESLRKRVDLHELLVFDAVPVTDGAAFEAAVAVAVAHLLDDERFIVGVDVHAARTGDPPIRPLPLRQGSYVVVPEEEGAAPAPSVPPRLLDDDAVAPRQASAAEKKLRRWKAQLLDLTLRNRLLNHRDTKTVLPLEVADLGELEDQLADGAVVRLVAEEEAGPERRLNVALGPAERDRRCIELYRSGRLQAEETGSSPLYLALGFLHWREHAEGEVRRAPLLLLPAVLERASVGGPYTVRLADEDASLNVTLVEKLSRDFGVKAEWSEELPTDESGLDVQRILHRWRVLVKDVKGFEVRAEAALAHYAFRKLLMWQDLELSLALLQRSPVVEHLFGGGGQAFPAGATLPRARDLDRAPAHEDLLVVDADSSQRAAVRAALDGGSFVLQGPPGTGKSQTITNMIAGMLAAGRTVLFVSEKKAALDVVHDRLVAIGLGDFCLEAHADGGSKKQFVDQLALSLRARPAASAWEEVAEALGEERDALNRVAAALHDPGPGGESAWLATAGLIGARGRPQLGLDVPVDGAALATVRRVARDLAVAATEARPRVDHPLAAVGLRDVGLESRREVERAVAEAGEALAGLHIAASAVAARLDGTAPADVVGVRRWGALAAHLASPPRGVDGLLRVRDGTARLAALAEVGRRRRAAWEALSARWTAAVLETDLAATRGPFLRWADAFMLLAWVMLFLPRWRLRAVACGGVPDNRSVAEDLGMALAVRADDAGLAGSEGAALLGGGWKLADTDWDGAEAVAAWVDRLRALAVSADGDPGVGLAVRAASERFAGEPDLLAGVLGQELRAVGVAQAEWQRARAGLGSTLRLDDAATEGGVSEVQDRLRGIGRASGELRAWAAWRRAGDTAQAAGAGALVGAVEAGDVAPSELVAVAEASVRHAALSTAHAAEPLLSRFSGRDVEARQERFRALDTEALAAARREVVARVVARLPDPGGPGEMAVLQREFGKRRRHKPPRRLFQEAGHVIRRLKPVVLMSPLSVARYLPPESEPFDLVVFDEASQIPPWDAVGAIARGTHVVVVGDSKQLPPTTFFGGGGSDEDVDDLDEVDLESILDECVAARMPQHRLRWHYRSRHEGLIAFSNAKYYGNALHTFPSAAQEVPELGVHLVRVDGVYDRGGQRWNRGEAEAVVAAVVRHLSHPVAREHSLGVVTFSSQQRRLVEDLLDEARGAHPGLDEAFTRTHEPVFVKNLENVQGDERDVMLFTVGYGPDVHGKVSMNFGPLNKAGGERRLNVAITRARRKLVVFATLRSDQIDLSRTRAQGVRDLAAFLAYAERGPRALDAALSVDPGADADSPFELEVQARLEARGHTIVRQVGCAGYRIDLAVQDPERPGAFLLGIECDGAAWHSGATARDRDLVRQRVLEGLGWRIARVWSTDWWHAPERETDRLCDAIEAASAEADTEVTVAPEPVVEVAPEPVAAAPVEPAVAAGPTPWPEGASAYVPAVLPSGDKDAFDGVGALRRVGEQLRALVEGEGPVPEEVALQRVRAAWGFGRMGRRIRDRLASAPLVGVVRRGDELWPDGLDPELWRGFRYVDGAARGLPAVTEAELLNVLEWVVDRAVAVEEEILLREAAAVFGTQVGARVRARLEGALAGLVEAGRAARSGSTVRSVG